MMCAHLMILWEAALFLKGLGESDILFGLNAKASLSLSSAPSRATSQALKRVFS